MRLFFLRKIVQLSFDILGKIVYTIIYISRHIAACCPCVSAAAETLGSDAVLSAYDTEKPASENGEAAKRSAESAEAPAESAEAPAEPDDANDAEGAK